MPEIDPSSPVPPVLPVASVASQPINHGKPFLPVTAVAAILLISSLAFGAYQLGKNQSSLPTPKPDITSPVAEPPTVSPAVSGPSALPSNPADPTANWKTYTSAFLGVSFKHPSEWNLKEASYGVGFEIEPDPRTVVGACPGYVLSVTTRLDPNETQKAFLPVLASTLDNQPVEVFEKTDEYGCLTKRIYVNKFPKEGYTPKLVISLGGKKPRLILDQILTTFKFLD